MNLKKLTALFMDPKRRVWGVMALGICGMLLIFLSRGSGEKPKAPETKAEAAFAADEYVQKLEERLLELVGEIEGVGNVKIMITLQNSGEYVFAQEEKRNTDKQTEPAVTQAARTSEKENVERKYVLVENDDGRRQALVKTQLEPSVQGVVIVCGGADDICVQYRVVNVVTTALNIPSTRVCVEKIRS